MASPVFFAAKQGNLLRKNGATCFADAVRYG